jgi:hypothetical protein
MDVVEAVMERFPVRQQPQVITYAEHVAQRKKWVAGAQAELAGFIQATAPGDPPCYSRNKYEQERYLQGFHDGRMVLQVEQAQG